MYLAWTPTLALRLWRPGTGRCLSGQARRFSLARAAALALGLRLLVGGCASRQVFRRVLDLGLGRIDACQFCVSSCCAGAPRRALALRRRQVSFKSRKDQAALGQIRTRSWAPEVPFNRSANVHFQQQGLFLSRQLHSTCFSMTYQTPKNLSPWLLAYLVGDNQRATRMASKHCLPENLEVYSYMVW